MDRVGKKFFLLCAAFILAVISILANAGSIKEPVEALAAGPVAVSFYPAAQSVANGSAFSINLAINTSIPSLGFQSNVNFDPAKVICNSVVEGTFLSDYAHAHGADTIAPVIARINNNTGIISNISYAVVGVDSGGATGSGTLCTLNFTAKSNINLLTVITAVNTLLFDSDSVSHNADITPGVVAVGNVPSTNIASFSPASGGNGAAITIFGTSFTGASAVSFGGVQAQSFTVNSDTQITAFVSNGANGNISVTSLAGTAIKPGFTYIAAPVINSFNPATASSGSSVVISGTGFSGTTNVDFGGTEATNFIINSDNQITAVVGNGATGSVSVTTSAGTAVKAGFVFYSTPTVQSFTPALAGAGMSVTISGTNFGDATAVSFGGSPAYNFTINSDNQITAVLGSGSSGIVSIITPGGTATVSGFTFMPAPSISGFMPANAGSGTTLTISGSNFTGTTLVSFGGVDASSFIVDSASQITATVGSGTSGVVNISTPYGSATKAGFVYIPAPIISSFSPASALTGTDITIIGANFTGTQKVSFGGVNAQRFTVTSDNQITARAATGASGDVLVVTIGGSATKPGFSFVAPNATFSVNPDEKTINNGDNFTIDLTITSSSGLLSWQSDILFDSSKVKCTGVREGNMLADYATSHGGITMPFSNPAIDNINGRISGISYGLLGIGGSGPTDSGHACILSFSSYRTATGNLSITPSNTAIYNANGQIIDNLSILSGVVNIHWPQPMIESFAPAVAAHNETITIIGSNFFAASRVDFGGTPAAGFVISSETQITAVVAFGSSGDVSVSTPGGTAAKAGFTFIPAPVINSFTPSAAGKGTIVIINGLNFTNASSVSFGGIPAQSYIVDSATQMSAVVGDGSTGNISLATPGGIDTKAGFTFIPAPVISSFLPIAAGKGTTVIINGTDLNNTSTVSFGGVAAQNYTLDSTTRIMAVVGDGATGNISLTTPGGTDNIAGFTFIPAPIINSFSPTLAGKGSTVTLTGLNFDNASAVNLGGALAQSYTVDSPTQITVKVGDGASGNISVTTAGGTGIKSGFNFVSAPAITSFSPQMGGAGTQVTIIGNYLNNAVSFSFGEIPALSLHVDSETHLTAVIGGGASGDVTLTTLGGTASLPGFIFVPAPRITSFNPTTAEKGDTVIITGMYLATASAVTFGQVPPFSYYVNSDDEITAVLGNVASGNVSVTTLGGTTALTGFNFHVPEPQITSFSPASASYLDAVVVNGTNLELTRSITFGGIGAHSFMVDSDTRITAVVGTGTSGEVAIMTPGGTTTLAGFTWLPPWDPNQDHSTDTGDIVYIGRFFYQAGLPGWIPADANRDGTVDTGDIIFIGRYFYQTW